MSERDSMFTPDDTALKSMIEARWRSATADMRSAMEQLRTLVPELDAYMAERTVGHFHSALDAAERGYSSLHHAGPMVLGDDEYKDYLALQALRKVGE